MVFMGLLFYGIYELHVMQLCVNFHILSPLLVNVAPVLQLPWLLSDSLLVIFPVSFEHIWHFLVIW